MATSFNIQGPTTLQIKQQAEGTTTASSFSTLGVTDNDDLIAVDFANILDPYYSTESGREPAAMIYQGTVATITATLIKWDTAVLDTLKTCVWEGGTGDGKPGSIGQDQLGAANFTHVENLQVKVVPTFTSNMETNSYQFLKCWVESMAETGWGNAPKKLVLTIKAVRASGGQLFMRASS